MRLAPGTPLSASFALRPDAEVPVGRLALDDAGVAQFEYDRLFLRGALRLDPRKTPQPGLVPAAEPQVFDGLHGVFADSLPDAWGRALLRRRAEQLGVAFGTLRGIDLLACTGRRGPGALVYAPAFAAPDGSSGTLDLDALDRLAGEARSIETGDDPGAAREQLVRLGGPSGGARPKILVGISDSGQLVPDDEPLPDGFASWIVKFRSSTNDVPDIGPLEAAYADMARAAGLDVAETRLIATRESPGYFATRRFDRGPNGTRHHLLSAAATLEADWRIPNFSYEMLLRLTRIATRDQASVEAVFRRAAFNVVAHNRDDHIKQHAFLMAADGRWRAAPSYDLTFNYGFNRSGHYLTVAGKDRDITRSDLLTLAVEADVHAAMAREIIEQVHDAVARFDEYATRYAVTPATRTEVKSALRTTRMQP